MPVISVQSFGITADTAQRLARSLRSHVTAALPQTEGVCQCRVLRCDAAALPKTVPVPNAWVEVTMFPGRSAEDKRALYEAIVAALGAVGVKADAVTVALHEPALENWGVRGGRPAGEASDEAPDREEGDPR